MCNSACYYAKRSTCRCRCGGSNHGHGRIRHGTDFSEVTREVVDESVDIVSEFIDTIKWPLLRGVVIGVSCSISPAACPAILTISKAADLAITASRIYDALTSGEKEKIAQAESEILSTTVSAAIISANEKQIESVSNGIGIQIAEHAFPSLGSGNPYIRRIATETARFTIEEGIGGLVSWVIE